MFLTKKSIKRSGNSHLDVHLSSSAFAVLRLPLYYSFTLFFFIDHEFRYRNSCSTLI